MTSVDSPLELHRWSSRPVVGVAVVVFAVGFAQFSPAAILADVATYFGGKGPGDGFTEQAGLSGTALGVGLGLVRVASLATLLFASVADRRGRRDVALWWVTLGLALTVAAAASPGYWVLVAALAAARPLLSATNTVALVLAAELTSSSERAMALALCTAAYGLGTGAIVVSRAALGEPNFRVVLMLALVPLLAVAAASRLVVESDRYRFDLVEPLQHPMRVDLGREFRRRLVLLAVATAAAALITGPANTFLFVYGENVIGMSPSATAALVVAGAPAGLVGLLVGRFAADRAGRRATACVALVLLATSTLVAYSGGQICFGVGFLAGILSGSAFAVPVLALANELFPTAVRASVAGWLVVSGVLGASAGLAVVGLLGDVFGGFGPAVALVCVPAAVSAVVLFGLPETRGLELEQAVTGVLQ